MILPAPKWLAWLYAIAFWLFVIAGLMGTDEVSAIGYLGMKVMFLLLAVGWLLGLVVNAILRRNRT